MLAAAVLLTYAAATMVGAPVVLAPRRQWPIRRPRLALALWHGAFGTGAATACAAIVVLLVTGAQAMTAGDSQAVPAVVLGWCAIFVSAAAGSLASHGWETVTSAERRNRALLLARPHTIGTDGDVTILKCHTPLPVACCLPGRSRAIVISDSIIAGLTPAQVTAVVAHERAHLRRRHHLATRLADLHLACLPALPSTQALRRATALLIELIADDDAARRVGSHRLAETLLQLGTAQHDPTLALRAERLMLRPDATSASSTPLA